ncbi:nucleoside transporter-domain-containing protein [Cryomyces antarcticus]
MERLRRLLRRRSSSYEPLDGGSIGPDGDRIEAGNEKHFSWIEYSIFFLLGIAMLWAWNMFLAAGPYFQHRFESNDRVFTNFQSAELSISTVANLGSVLVLTKLQARASYPKRIIASLVINIITFTLLAMSTRLFMEASAGVYFAFLMLMVFAASLATGLCQNGVFAYVSGFGQGEYTQAIMTGQAVAGVLPCIAQIVSVLSVSNGDSSQPHHKPDGSPPVPSTAAFSYFLTATGISFLTLLAFLYLANRHRAQSSSKRAVETLDTADEAADIERKAVPLLTLLSKLRWLAAAVFLTFAITMFFPVFTQKIYSVRDPLSGPRLLQPASFVPLAFFWWNTGDLFGRLLTAIPALSLVKKPKVVFALSVARVLFIPLYLLCNIRGHGAKINSDVFYLLVVQLLFGTTNGFLGSTCMMGAGEWVDVEEREAAGGLMGLCLVAGLTVGSLLSFFAA